MNPISDPVLNKIFVRDITEHASNTFLEALMNVTYSLTKQQIFKVCGPIVKFKRTKMNNKFANFGYVEFEEIAGVYTCLRCLQGF